MQLIGNTAMAHIHSLEATSYEASTTHTYALGGEQDQMEMTLEDKTTPASINLVELTKKLRESGMDVTEKDIELKTNPSLETAEMLEKGKEIVEAYFRSFSRNPSDSNKPALNAWQRAAIKLRISRL